MFNNLSEKTKLIIARSIAILILFLIAVSLIWIANQDNVKDPNKTETIISTPATEKPQRTTSTLSIDKSTSSINEVLRIPLIAKEDKSTTQTLVNDSVSSVSKDLDLTTSNTMETSTSTEMLISVPEFPQDSILVKNVKDVPSLSDLDKDKTKNEEKNEEKTSKNVTNKQEVKNTTKKEVSSSKTKKEEPKETKKVVSNSKVKTQAKAKATPTPSPTPVVIQRFAVEIYGASWCAACKSLKAQMDQRGYIEGKDYNYIDIERENVPNDVKEFMKKNGFIPVVQFNGTIDNGAALRKYYNLK